MNQNKEICTIINSLVVKLWNDMTDALDKDDTNPTMQELFWGFDEAEMKKLLRNNLTMNDFTAIFQIVFLIQHTRLRFKENSTMTPKKFCWEDMPIDQDKLQIALAIVNYFTPEIDSLFILGTHNVKHVCMSFFTQKIDVDMRFQLWTMWSDAVVNWIN